MRKRNVLLGVIFLPKPRWQKMEDFPDIKKKKKVNQLKEKEGENGPSRQVNK